ncbi:MAG TPA: triphosphoribosyl-dephospho-CoA synthase, partial [Polyangiaceae bacterium]|nr:triphosphoribosyl-dephospho-CoA synthase [Polyangiaceae bacterium]
MTKRLATLAVNALIEEATLTPKPALVDRQSNGAHRDLDLARMLRSAAALHPAFAAMGHAAAGQAPSQRLREKLGRIGREGEAAMLTATGGSNAHRGAIWIVGLLVAGAAMSGPFATAHAIADAAAHVARFRDRFTPDLASNGARACARYGVTGARGEARGG